MPIEKPVVVIKCLVYNHEPYLRQCLDGFVMQQTDFPFVAIVHDDASTDRSADIIHEYAERYPDIICPIYETENQYSKKDGSFGRIMNTAIDATEAKYIAMCEGDDYWIDPYKLQKQVDFLENHTNYSLCCHRINCFMQDTGVFQQEVRQDMIGHSTIEDLVSKGNYIATCSVLIRRINSVNEKMRLMGSVIPGDYPYWILTSECGDIYKMSDVMAIYRVGSGLWSSEKNNVRLKLYEYSMRNRLRMVVSEESIKLLIDKQATKDAFEILSVYSNSVEENIRTRRSMAFRVGKMLLRPFNKLRSLFQF